jgi:serine/threonine protein kinase
MSMIGKTLAHYEITSRLGKGGMGEVYQAKDRKLGRDVAIKVLPEEFAKDADRVSRFQREAKLLASLNHPNIAAIYGLEESGGKNFLVLELVEGDTLADQIKKGPIPVEETLRLALQIAEALEAAHEKGVIHRDLKPANIKVTPDGKVKVLDFGLAKAFAPDREMNRSNSPTLTHSPTLSDMATRQGVILGTAAYMSPEQAKGKAVGRQADVWAFGVVLYEMLTGRQLFAADTALDTLARVLTNEPDLEIVPVRVRPLLRRCLQKNPKERLRDIGDVKLELQEAIAGTNEVLVAPVTALEPQRRLRTILLWAASLALMATIAGLTGWQLKPLLPRPIARFSCFLPADQTLISGTMQAIAISPDSSRFVCATNKGLYLRSMDQLQGRIIPGTEGEVGNPLFSPDGQWVGFWSGRDKQLKKIPIGGGSPVTICVAERSCDAFWGTDNFILFDGDDSRIMRASADGGTPEKILEIKEKDDQFYAPQLLPDGTNLLLTFGRIGRDFDMKIAVQSLRSGTRKELFAGRSARYLNTGHLVYVQGGDLFAVPFDANSLKVTGGSVPMVQGVAGIVARYAVSSSGALVYVQSAGGSSGESKSILVWVDRNGKEEAIEAPPRAYTYTSVTSNMTSGSGT